MIRDTIKYEKIDACQLYRGDEINPKAIDRIKEAWTDREIIQFNIVNGTVIYVMGTESRKDNGEWFVTIMPDGLPDTIVGSVHDLIEYMGQHRADYFSVYEA